MRFSSLTDRLFGSPAKRNDASDQAAEPVDSAVEKPVDRVEKNTVARPAIESPPKAREVERRSLDERAIRSRPQARPDEARFVDRSATESPAEEQEDEHQYVDVSDLKKSLDKARQALRNAQKAD